MRKTTTRKEAQSLGLPHYFTGKPCPQGHIGVRRVVNRECVVCRLPKLVLAHSKHHAKLKAEARARVGDRCACCGEDRRVFLTVHHKDGDGPTHRAAWGNGPRYHRWILKQSVQILRRKLEILCANCHLAVSVLGYCPHRPRRKAVHK